MGFGDELIASGQARELNEKTGKRVRILGAKGQRRWSEVWAGNPRIVRLDELILAQSDQPVTLVNGPNARPYIEAKSDRKWTWRDFNPPVGELYLTDNERSSARGFAPDVLVEPGIKSWASPNKDWGRARWQALVDLLLGEGLKVGQIGPPGTRFLTGVIPRETPGFRYGCAALERVRVAILPDGGLHHAAAALGIPAVVIYGGYISDKQTGYASQVSLFTGGEPCGMRVPCEHCARAMAAIEPERVLREALTLLQKEVA